MEIALPAAMGYCRILVRSRRQRGAWIERRVMRRKGSKALGGRGRVSRPLVRSGLLYQLRDLDFEDSPSLRWKKTAVRARAIAIIGTVYNIVLLLPKESTVCRISRGLYNLVQRCVLTRRATKVKMKLTIAITNPTAVPFRYPRVAKIEAE